jgi:hypothetical protein
VGDYTQFPGITLAAGETMTTNLNLMAATCTLSGSLVDSTNFSVAAVPDAQLLVFSTNSLVTIAVADRNGNFTVPVTTNNIWSVRPLAQSALPEACLPVESGNEARFQTFAGPVSGALIKLKHAGSVLYGLVQDNHGAPIPGVSLVANGDGGQYDGYAISDANGNYFLAIDAGGGFIQVQNTGDAPADNFLWTGTPFFVANGQALNTNVIGTLSTARFRSFVADETGAPVSNVFCFATCPTGTSAGNTGSHGMLDMPVFAGTWNLYIGSTNVVFPVIPPFTITDGFNFTNNIVARTITGHISGRVHNAANTGIPNIGVTVTNNVGQTNFVLHTVTDMAGNYSVAVFNGTWNASLDPSGLRVAGYLPVNPLDVPVPPANATADFIPAPIPAPQILTTNLPGSVLGDFYFTELEATNGVPSLVWTLDSGTLPGGLIVDGYGPGTLSGTITNSGLFNFTVRVMDAVGQTATEALSINVLAVAPGPLTISNTTLPPGAMGCPYNNQLQATGGAPPYSWSLSPLSGPLPPDLMLGTNGMISGSPATNSYSTLGFEVSDSLGQSASQTIYLVINPPLQVYPGPLSGGELGLDYSGGLYASGGEQPQTWSIVSGSLPPHLTLDPASGAISGSPTAAGTSNFKARVTDGCATVDLDTSITIYPAPILTTPATLFATTGALFSAQLAVSGGAPPFYFYTAGPLPFGLSLGYDGLISGTSYFDDTNSFEVQVYDNVGGGCTANLTIITSLLPLLDNPIVVAANQFSFRVTGVSGQSYTGSR